jgi:hypothetical protein
MGMNFKNPEALRMARQLAVRRGTTVTVQCGKRTSRLYWNASAGCTGLKG